LSSDLGPTLAALGRAAQEYQGAVDDFDRETARLLGVNETDQRCLELLLGNENATPRWLAGALGLTTGSVTAMLDRLARLGHLTRSPHPTDRRSSIVRITPETSRRVYEIIEPHINDTNRRLGARYTAQELELITGFLKLSTEIQRTHVERLRAGRLS